MQAINISVCLNQVDPFLHLFEDKKLRAIHTGSDLPKIIFGSKEDDDLALKFLSEIENTDDQTRESLTSEILKSLENLPTIQLSSVQFLCEIDNYFSLLNIWVWLLYMINIFL